LCFTGACFTLYVLRKPFLASSEPPMGSPHVLHLLFCPLFRGALGRFLPPSEPCLKPRNCPSFFPPRLEALRRGFLREPSREPLKGPLRRSSERKIPQPKGPFLKALLTLFSTAGNRWSTAHFSRRWLPPLQRSATPLSTGGGRPLVLEMKLKTLLTET
jgi:hypothetical protein